MTAFPEPERTLWTAYADSRRRPRRVHALGAEHLETARRVVASPPVVVPERESGDAYVRRWQGGIYICPWETRLRSWLAFSRFRERTSERIAGWYVPPRSARDAAKSFERWKRAGRPLRPHIQTSTWHVPLPWFVPFTTAGRCLVLGTSAPERGQGGGPATASGTRTLIYVTSMNEARARIEAALPVVAGGGDEESGLVPGEIEALDRWLAEFDPHAIVELDYGGLVHLLDDGSLCADESVAEVGVALAALARGQTELCVAMRERLNARWRRVRALESAN